MKNLPSDEATSAMRGNNGSLHSELLRASSTSPRNRNDNNLNGNGAVSNLNDRNLNIDLANRNGTYNNSNYAKLERTGRSENGAGSLSLPRGFKTDKFEIPLPFGYHLDLDFLRFCSDELVVSNDTLEKLKELRKTRRQQRKTLEALMGMKQEQRKKKSRESPATTHTSTLTLLHSPSPELLRHNDFMKEALFDFEQCLDSTNDSMTSFDLIHGSKEVRAKLNACHHGRQAFEDLQPTCSSTPSANGTNAASGQPWAESRKRQASNSSLSSISTSSSALPYTSPPDASFLDPSTAKPDPMETESIASISSEMSTTTLRNVREQMAKSLTKLREYEKQVEAIPVMQIKLSVLKEEKRLLMLKLKQRELQLSRERGELEMSATEELFEGETDETDFEDHGVRTRWITPGPRRRARSESPYGRLGVFQPEEFLSVRKKRSPSCGYNSDASNDLERRYFEAEFSAGRMGRSANKHSDPRSPTERSEVSIYANGSSVERRVTREPTFGFYDKAETREAGTNTDYQRPPPELRPVSKRNRASNTDPPPKSPPLPRKVSSATNTSLPRTVAKSTSPVLSMNSFVSVDEMETRIQEAVFKTEEEIMGCPLLQKAMAKVEEEALRGPSEGSVHKSAVETADAQCQVGEENLNPFVITVGLQCKIEEEAIRECEKCNARAAAAESTTDRFLAAVGATDRHHVVLKSIGVGDCKVIEDPPDPTRYREIGVCTEKWIEVIKASKQTDTEDFAYKDTESPRVADIFPFEPEPDRVVMERRSSLRRSMGALPASPYFSRKSSGTSSPVNSRKNTLNVSATSRGAATTKTVGTNTDKDGDKPKILRKDAKTQNVILTKNVSTSAMILSLTSDSKPSPLVPGSPLTPDSEKPPVNMNLCDKCSKDIKEVAEGIVAGPPSAKSGVKKIYQPPSPEMPWLSKIPRPVPENPDVYRLKAATSTGSLATADSRPKSPGLLQRSKSNLTPSTSRRVSSPKGNLLSPPSRGGNVTGTLSPRGNITGTPPPHPSTPPVGSRRLSSPSARSNSPHSAIGGGGGRKSLIPKFNPGTPRANQPPSDPVAGRSGSSATTSCLSPSLIPRVVTPPALRKMYPKDGMDKLAAPDRNVVRKHIYTKATTGVSNPELEKTPTPIKDEQSGSPVSTSDKQSTTSADKAMDLDSSDKEDEGGGNVTDEGTTSDTRLSSSGFPLPGASLFAPIDENRSKAQPSKEMKAALKVLNDSFAKGSSKSNTVVTNAVNIVQQEWFKTSSTKQSHPLHVEDYLDVLEDFSKELLGCVVNMTDVNGNTALHYSVSHGNFDVVSVLLDSKVANPNIFNKAGYTCIMLVALAQIANDTHRAVISRLFNMGDVNVRASQHGQTALMLAVSHGRLDMVQLLVEAGAAVNISDDDGSTALMCAAEHGYVEIVKYIMAQPDTDVNAKDNDGLTALAVAMEAGHRNIGVILYAGMSFSTSRGTPPHSSIRTKRPVSSSSSRTNTLPSRGSTVSNNNTEKSSLRSSLTQQPPSRFRHNSSNS